MSKGSFVYKIYNAGPLILLYYLCISEVDTNLEKYLKFYSKLSNYTNFIGIKDQILWLMATSLSLDLLMM